MWNGKTSCIYALELARVLMDGRFSRPSEHLIIRIFHLINLAAKL